MRQLKTRLDKLLYQETSQLFTRILLFHQGCNYERNKQRRKQAALQIIADNTRQKIQTPPPEPETKAAAGKKYEKQTKGIKKGVELRSRGASALSRLPVRVRSSNPGGSEPDRRPRVSPTVWPTDANVARVNDETRQLVPDSQHGNAGITTRCCFADRIKEASATDGLSSCLAARLVDPLCFLSAACV